MNLTALGILLIAAVASVNSQTGPSTQFEIDILAAHNEYRAKHGVPPLEWSPQLAQVAQEWATHLAMTNIMRHRPNSKYGENIFYAWNMEIDNKQAVVNWYNEIKQYDFNNGNFNPNTGHFTQVVWKNTKSLGAAMVKTSDNKIWVVANYDPPGNYMGQFAENVLPPKM